MKFSAPIYLLKQQAKSLARAENIPLSQALDRIAKREGFATWSLLVSKAPKATPASTLLGQIRPGDLVLLGSRRGQGKTLLGTELAIQTMRGGNRAAFFTLDCTLKDVADLFKVLRQNVNDYESMFLVDDSDQICAEYIISKLAFAPASTLVVIDYLQVLDQRRENADITQQVRQLRDFAKERQLIVICLSQIDRRYDPEKQPCPGIHDVRLPNPLDLALFDKACFLSQGRMQIASTA